MITLLAIVPEDGWAFVQRDDQTMLVRPPYSRANCTVVSGETVTTAVAKHNFFTLEKEFESWRDLIAFLNRQVAESRRSFGHNLQSAQIGPSLLHYAPPQVLGELLTRAEKEWFPECRWNALEKLLVDVLQLPAVKSNPELSSRALVLLRRCLDTKESRAKAREEELGIDEIRRTFPRIDAIAADVWKIEEEVTKRGQVFA